MDIVGPIIGLMGLVVFALLILAGLYTFTEAVYNALKAVPEISKELTKIRKLLEKKEG